jgi:hypothetical protein
MIVQEEPDLTYRVLKAIADCNGHNDVWWAVDDSIHFYVDAGTAFDCHAGDLTAPDMVPIDEHTIDTLEDCVRRVRRLAEDPTNRSYATLLFACRVLQLRPHSTAYPASFRALWPWLDACGRERQLTFTDATRESDRKS